MNKTSTVVYIGIAILAVMAFVLFVAKPKISDDGKSIKILNFK